MAEATLLWRKATGKHDTLPDLGDLLAWLHPQARSAVHAGQRKIRMDDQVASRLLDLLHDPSPEMIEAGKTVVARLQERGFNGPLTLALAAWRVMAMRAIEESQKKL